MAEMKIESAGSLNRLVDIVSIEEVSWWPLAPGWWVLFVFLLVVLVIMVVWSVRRWRGNAYRRAACVELESIGELVSVDEVNALLKRTALSFRPREEIAGLAGNAWIDFLRQSGPLSENGVRMLNLAYTSSVFTGSEGVELKEAARAWIEGHRLEGSDAELGGSLPR